MENSKTPNPRLRALSLWWNHSLDTTTKSGFPVTVWIDTRLDLGDEGWTEILYDYDITTRRGYRCKWLGLSDSEMERMADEAFQDLMAKKKTVTI